MTDESLTDKGQVKDGELCRKEFEAWFTTARQEHRIIADYEISRSEYDFMFLAWQASRQPLLSQLAIAREALEGIVKSSIMYQREFEGYAYVYAGDMYNTAKQALKSLSLDNPVEEK
jgi:hypothetical protein